MGSLEPPVQSTQWRRPSEAWVEEIDGKSWICWSGPYLDTRHGVEQEELLLEFMSLASAEPDQFAAYAKQWGPLALCGHGLPSTHLARQHATDLAMIYAEPCFPLRYHFDDGPLIREPIETWRRLASQASATYEAVRLVEQGRRVPDDLWGRVRGLIPTNVAVTVDDFFEAGVVRTKKDIDDHERRLLQLVIHRWMHIGDVGLRVHWDKQKLRVRYAGTGLAGALALELALTTTSTRLLSTCDGCGQTYEAKKKPKEGVYHYCDDCRDKGIPSRNRSRAYRERRRAERENAVTLN